MIDESKHALRIVEINSESAKRQPIADNTVRQMYNLLGSNMTGIIGASSPDWKADEEFDKWKNGVFHKGLQESVRHILLYDKNGLRGFISYTAPVDGTEIYLNEFQIQPHAQADGVAFKRLLLRFIEQIRELPHDSIRTYANKLNERAQSLIEKLGFQREKETERGIRYTMKKDALQIRLHRLERKRRQ